MRKAFKFAAYVAAMIALMFAGDLLLNSVSDALGKLFGMPQAAHQISAFIAMLIFIIVARMELRGVERDRDRQRKLLEDERCKLELCRVAAFGGLDGLSERHPLWSPALREVLNARKELERTRAAYAEKCEEANAPREDEAHLSKVVAAARSASC